MIVQITVMAKFGYHVSHEQFKPSTLLQYVQLAEQAGFTHALSSDHFYPWSELQGQSGFAWSWLGAALQATNLTFGVVNAPGQRYHPAIIAQAAATLAEMFPNRFWVALGSGQALNEHMDSSRSVPLRSWRGKWLSAWVVFPSVSAGFFGFSLPIEGVPTITLNGTPLLQLDSA